MVRKEYSVNDLPLFSSWPARLLGLESWEKKIKTPQEVTREFEYETWGPLLETVKKTDKFLRVEDVDEMVFHDTQVFLCSVGNHLTMLNYQDAQKKYLNLFEKILKKYLPASALIELGAGYGSVLIPLARGKSFSNVPVYAGEYTASGIELIQMLSKREKKQIITGHCDFNLPGFLDFEIPPGGIIFTSFSAHYLPKVTEKFVDSFLSLNPKVIINVEPCYDHFTGDTLIDLMRRRYIEVNDYNRNLVTLLKDCEREGKIKILEELPLLFGTNPLLPASILVWTGQRQTS